MTIDIEKATQVELEAATKTATAAFLDLVNPVIAEAVDKAVPDTDWPGDVDPLSSMRFDDAVESLLRQLCENALEAKARKDPLGTRFHKAVLDHLTVDAGLTANYEWPGYIAILAVPHEDLAEQRWVWVGQTQWEHATVVDGRGDATSEGPIDIRANPDVANCPSELALHLVKVLDRTFRVCPICLKSVMR